MRNLRDFDADPEPPNENDPEFREEIFEMLRRRGTKPEDLRNRKDAKQYAEWLKTAPALDEEGD